jgi:hypothetical protein
MIFKVNRKTSEIKVHSSSWTPKELEVEKYILPEKNLDQHILNPEVFKEDLLLVKNQARTSRGKRADIFGFG